MQRPFTPPPRQPDQMDITPIQPITPSPRPPLSTSLSDFSLPQNTIASAPSSPSGGSSHMTLLGDSAPSALTSNSSVHTYSGISSGTLPILDPPFPSYPLLRRLRRPSLLGLVMDRANNAGQSKLSSSPNQGASPLSMSLFERRLAASGGGGGGNNAAGSTRDLKVSGSGSTSNQLDQPMATSSSSSSSVSGTSTSSSTSLSGRINTPPPLLVPSSDPKSTPRTPISKSAGLPSTSVSSPMQFEHNTETRTPLAVRRASFPLRVPRVNTLLSEFTTPISLSETRSEAQFQRLLASNSELPVNIHGSASKTLRTWSVTGRYPESAGGDDTFELDDWSEGSDGEAPEDAGNGIGNIDINMNSSMSGRASPAGSMMDVDMGSFGFGSPTNSSIHSHWREPMPTRPNKRKLTDERYDPYPVPANKRRAGSPSMSQFGYNSSPFPSPYPINIPRSPIIQTPRPTSSGSLSSSPVLRPMSSAAAMLSSSPVMRPIQRVLGSSTNGRDSGEREVENTGEGVNGLTLA